MYKEKNKSIYKLNGFPTIYYNNLDDDVLKREYMESQFEYWEISNYHRTSGYDGRKSDLSEILVGRYPDQMNSRDVGSATSHMKSIKTWLENSDESEKAMVVMEDDCDLSTVTYWTFVWKDLTSKLPPDWDIVQLAVINPVSITIKIHRTSATYVGSVATVHSIHTRRSRWTLNARDSVNTGETGHTHFASVSFRASRSLGSWLSLVSFRAFKTLHSLETLKTRRTGISWGTGRSLETIKNNNSSDLMKSIDRVDISVAFSLLKVTLC